MRTSEAQLNLIRAFTVRLHKYGILDSTKCMNGEQRLGLYFAHAQDDLNMRILLEGTFSQDEAQVK